MAFRSTRPKGQLETALGVARIGAMLIGAVSVSVAVVKLAVPLYQYVVFTAVPAAWAGFRSLLAPQYLFLLVNLIILVIWKLSEKKQQPPQDNSQHFRTEAAAPASAPPVKPMIVHVVPPSSSPRMLHVREDIIPPSPRKPAYSHVDAMPSPRKPAYIHALPPPSTPRKAPIRDDDSPPRATPRNVHRPPSPDTNSDDSCVTAEDDSMEYHSPEPVSPLRHRRLAAIATPSRSAPVSPYYPTGGGRSGPQVPDAPESLEDAWKAITGSGAQDPQGRARGLPWRRFRRWCGSATATS